MFLYESEKKCVLYDILGKEIKDMKQLENDRWMAGEWNNIVVRLYLLFDVLPHSSKT